MTGLSGARLMSGLPAVSLDLETTGLDVRRDRVVSVAAVPLSGGLILRERVFERLVRPEVPIPPLATRIHGITDEMVAAAQTLPNVLAELLAVISDRIIIGHSIGFDLAILRHESARNGIAWEERAWLDTGLLAIALNPALAQGGLESVADWLDVEVDGRHTALGDALIAAEIYVRLLPRLRDAGVRTLAEARRFQATAQAALNLQEAAGWFTVPSQAGTLAGSLATPAVSGLERLDSYVYRHRLEQIMSAPEFVAGDASLIEVARRLRSSMTGAVLVTSVGSGNDLGILTERDLVDAIARGDERVLSTTAREHATKPVASLPQSAFVYQAIGRMQRMGTGHLAVVNEAGQVQGIVTAKALLEGRRAPAILLGDRVMTAATPHDLALAADELPAVARGLLDTGMSVLAIAAVISDALHHLAVRAATLTEERMRSRGHGAAPVPWALLLLGSAGRGESLLAPDQDNAIVYLGTRRHDLWFEMFAHAFVEILNEAGVPYCSGDVMASNPMWRRTLADWNERLGVWLDMRAADCLHNINAFFDMKPVYGDVRVAEELQGNAVRMATSHPGTLERMAKVLSGLRPPLGIFGGFELESGRVNLKTAILPLVTAARILALLVGSTARSTADRLREAAASTRLSRDDAERMCDIYEFLMNLVLAQQLYDLEHGVAPSTRIEVSRLDAGERSRLREALRGIDRLLRDFPACCARR